MLTYLQAIVSRGKSFCEAWQSAVHSGFRASCGGIAQNDSFRGSSMTLAKNGVQ
jgi:hypothetical protein